MSDSERTVHIYRNVDSNLNVVDWGVDVREKNGNVIYACVVRPEWVNHPIAGLIDTILADIRNDQIEQLLDIIGMDCVRLEAKESTDDQTL